MMQRASFRKVDGTAMDFRQMRRLGDGIEENAAEIRLFGGYDHNFILDQEGTAVMVNQEGVAAMAYSPKSKILMTMHTDQPGVQLFTCNDMGMVDGKAGKKYGNYSVFAWRPSIIRIVSIIRSGHLRC